MNFTGIVGIALMTAALALMLRHKNAEQSMALGLVAGVLIIVEILRSAAPAVKEIASLMQSTNIDQAYGSILLKTLAVSLLAQFAADACRDAKETALAAKVELAGRVEILLLALPLFQRIASTAAALIGGS